MQKTYEIKTYGCQMNVHESGKVAIALESIGYVMPGEGVVPDVLIFNTCTVRNTAESKILSHIALAVYEKQKKHNKQIIAVVGCLSQRDGAGKKLRQRFPEIDIIIGTHNISKIAEFVKRAEAGERIFEIKKEREKAEQFDNLVVPGDPQKPNTHYVNISHGCDNFCTYCIVPYVRGALTMRPSAEITNEFTTIVKTIKEKQSRETHTIYLLGQNVNNYFCNETGLDFTALLKHLCNLVDDKIMINFLSAHPRDVSPKLVDIIAQYPQIERNIHLPIQSGSDKILEQMNRGYSVADYKSIITEWRTKIPGIRITTDIICGFPGETAQDFDDTVKTIQDIEFNAAFIFPFSRRSGTPADKMDNQVSHAEKKKRTTQLIAIQREISKKLG
ncbi:MAG: MiaB/RimO family radical SAM methylthiotransferase [Firmicutes bacterium]|nr:MiaB/RimO family radical SAM methylthiotransferase [Bacillota bacterium]